MRLALLLVLGVTLHSPPHQSTSSPIHPDIRLTRTVHGVRLRIAGIDVQPVHVFVVGGTGLRAFLHERLDRQPDGSFAVDLALADAGLYMAFAEYVRPGAWPQMAQQAFTIGSPLTPHPGEPAEEAHESDGITAAIDVSHVKSGGESTLAFDLNDESPGPWAEAFAVSADLTEAQHLFTQDPSPGAHVVFTPIFPHSGRYKVWLLVQRGAHAATIPFVIDVP